MMHARWLRCAFCILVQKGYQITPEDIEQLELCHDKILGKMRSGQALESFERALVWAVQQLNSQCRLTKPSNQVSLPTLVVLKSHLSRQFLLPKSLQVCKKHCICLSASPH